MVWTTDEGKYRPAASLTIVTDDGSAGSRRDQRTARSPIFGSLSRPLSRTANRLFLVKRMAWRLSLRERNRGGATFRPVRVPVLEVKKVR